MGVPDPEGLTGIGKLARYHGSRQEQKIVMVIDVAVPRDSNIRK